VTAAALRLPRGIGLRGLLLRAALLAGLGAAGLGAGFLWFAHAALRAGPAPPRADGIVALTGGADRIETALRLLLAGRARVLLISGVAPAADLADLVRRIHLDPARVAGRVTLGHRAASTVGNATETAAWVRTHAVRTLIVVTAGYHMPRALLEIGRAMPDIRLYPDAVLPPPLRGRLDGAMLRLLAVEYAKYLGALVGLPRLPRAAG
jgi:uncharacterized SAM-binding protein YcdF (DUF218 family)